MAEIRLVTGIPGHGKTLYTIWLGKQFLAEGRPVYAAGFRDLDYDATGFLPLPSPFESFDRENLDYAGFIRPDWMLLEGAVILLDECYGVMPSRAPGRAVPPHIDALARHRHYNIDLVLVTQKHNQIDSFVQGLINTHVHVKNRFGFKRSVLRTFDGFESNPAKATPDRAPLWAFPKELYGVYKSATEHSIKRRIPWFLWAPLPLVALIVGLVWYVVHSFGEKGRPAPAATAAVAAGGAGAGSSSPSSLASRESTEDRLRHSDYAQWMTPRVAGQPWTAPAFDTLRVQAMPRLFCAAVEDATCHCITEQGTAYKVDVAVCRTIARDGVYNPFLPSDEGREDRRDSRRERSERARVADQSDAQSMGGEVSAWPSSPMRAAYNPPELTRAPGGD